MHVECGNCIQTCTIAKPLLQVARGQLGVAQTTGMACPMKASSHTVDTAVLPCRPCDPHAWRNFTPAVQMYCIRSTSCCASDTLPHAAGLTPNIATVEPSTHPQHPANCERHLPPFCCQTHQHSHAHCCNPAPHRRALHTEGVLLQPQMAAAGCHNCTHGACGVVHTGAHVSAHGTSSFCIR